MLRADGQWLYGGTSSGDIVTMNILRKSMQMVHPACGGGVGAMIMSSQVRPCRWCTRRAGGGVGAMIM